MFRRPSLTFALALALSTSAMAQVFPRAGFRATLQTLAHGAAGQVTIVDDHTLLVEHFYYDGFAIDGYFRVGADINESSFAAGLLIPPQIANLPMVDATFTLTLPAGNTLGPYTAVSFWCETLGFSMGKGPFLQVAPETFCVGKVNSIGCTPSIASSGLPNATGAGAFSITGWSFINNNNGMLFYGFGTNSTPFQGGTLCVQTPLRRTAIQNAGGNVVGHDCSGVYTYDFNARIASGVDPMLVAGRTVCAQYYARDVTSSFGISLSNGIRFAIAP